MPNAPGGNSRSIDPSARFQIRTHSLTAQQAEPSGLKQKWGYRRSDVFCVAAIRPVVKSARPIFGPCEKATYLRSGLKAGTQNVDGHGEDRFRGGVFQPLPASTSRRSAMKRSCERKAAHLMFCSPSIARPQTLVMRLPSSHQSSVRSLRSCSTLISTWPASSLIASGVALCRNGGCQDHARPDERSHSVRRVCGSGCFCGRAKAQQ